MDAYLDGAHYATGSSELVEIKAGVTNPVTVKMSQVIVPLASYTVSFDSVGGSSVPVQTIEEGGRITKPVDPVLEGRDFSGWFVDAQYTTLWDFESGTVSADITLYAKWTMAYTVTFNIGNIAEIPPLTNVEPGSFIEKPADPVKTGLTINGWYKDAEYTLPWIFAGNTAGVEPDKVTSNVTLYAKYTYMVVYLEANNGSPNIELAANEDGTISKPANPTKPGHDFGGWYKDDGTFLEPWKFADEPNADTASGKITLYAKWTQTIFSNVEAIIEYLSDASVSGTMESPVDIKAAMNLGDLSQENSVWRNLLNALSSATDYVNLDISGCTIVGTEFINNQQVIPYYIREISLPSSVTSIGDFAFSGCTELTKITLPSDLTSIGDTAFGGCTGLTEISIPSGVTSISNSAFWGCTGLTEISIPLGVTSIGNNAFQSCTELTKITFPSGLTSIGSGAFVGCTGLTEITLPSSVTYIGNGAFGVCTGLISVSLQAGVVMIGYDNPFSGCTSLTSFTVTGHGTALSTVFDGKALVRNGTDLISYTSASGSVTIPAGITSIGNNAFWGCTGLTEITMPSSVTSIGINVFYGSSDLALITCKAENPPTWSSGSYQAYPGRQIKVPAGSVAAYKAASGWSQYADIISAIDE